MITVDPGEQLFPLPNAIEKATGIRPSISTAHRWRLCTRNPLPTVKLGGRRLTSVEAVKRWVAVANKANQQEVRSPNSIANQKSSKDIERGLKEEGL